MLAIHIEVKKAYLYHQEMLNSQPHSIFNLKAIAIRLVLFFSLGLTMINRDPLSSNHPFANPTIHTFPSPNARLSVVGTTFDGHLSFENIEHAAKDFGNRYNLMPLAVLHPKSVSDISFIVKYVFDLGLNSELTIAARGHGHSLEGQAQAYKGVVINMESLGDNNKVPAMRMSFFCGGAGENDDDDPYVEVSGGELWINILHESVKLGLTPRSWTDYLHLTVGGTLSNAGISGQAFRHGPQIDNVYQLQVVTGKGEVVNCSEEHNSDLFQAVLGGLGQFGIITQARIALEPAPTMVKWMRALYSDFSIFSNDQEHLISNSKNKSNNFDYIEGFVVINQTDLLNNWRSSSFNPKDHHLLPNANHFVSQGKILFYLEVAKYFRPEDSHQIDQDINGMLSELNYIGSTLFLSEVSYIDFLDRVHISEIKLREKGLWEVPHLWLNLLVPKNSIHEFAEHVFGNIVKDTNNGPVLIYPVNKSRWKINKKSLITPDEDIFYLVAFLSSAIPSSTGKDSLQSILTQNNKILEFVEKPHLGIKQYLPHYTTAQEWENHFGTHWGAFSTRKSTYDPLAILAPGHRIFQRSKATYWTTTI